MIQKEELPEEQLHLTFESKDQDKEETLITDLFQSNLTNKNTIVAQSKQLQLFADEMDVKRGERNTQQIIHSISMTAVMLFLLFIAIALLFLIVPKLKPTQS
ncbi:type VII secretion protein EssA [Pontibacillus litoralis]|uniref:Uncharacterized protein n=1 Tax=Pontibacillus litoralis JSM 072002 TaxID=1385512 RepID=A0A0A5HVE2_9BACI|nr:type VII secretion protein EssA [Pontibacillus litoralis]KGX87602.1 hypothetical protein N784_15250 [Pontibacillus litoralis JSM 072002]